MNISIDIEDAKELLYFLRHVTIDKDVNIPQVVHDINRKVALHDTMFGDDK